MKKFFITVLLLSLTFSLNAKELKSYVTGAYNYGLFTERSDSVKTEISSNGFDLNMASFSKDNNWGFYLNTGYYFPSKMTLYSQGVGVSVEDSNWDFSMLISMILGTAYKHSLSENFEIMAAGGFHFAEYSMSSEYASVLNFSFGIGGDLAVRYLPTKNFYVTGGCIFSHDFYASGQTSTYLTGTTKIKDWYNFGSFRPYIGIGVSFAETIR